VNSSTCLSAVPVLTSSGVVSECGVALSGDTFSGVCIGGEYGKETINSSVSDILDQCSKIGDSNKFTQSSDLDGHSQSIEFSEFTQECELAENTLEEEKKQGPVRISQLSVERTCAASSSERVNTSLEPDDADDQCKSVREEGGHLNERQSKKGTGNNEHCPE